MSGRALRLLVAAAGLIAGLVVVAAPVERVAAAPNDIIAIEIEAG